MPSAATAIWLAIVSRCVLPVTVSIVNSLPPLVSSATVPSGDTAIAVTPESIRDHGPFKYVCDQKFPLNCSSKSTPAEVRPKDFVPVFSWAQLTDLRFCNDRNPPKVPRSYSTPSEDTPIWLTCESSRPLLPSLLNAKRLPLVSME